MLIHQLIVLPTPETLEYLKTVFDACPIEIDWHGVFVEVNSSTEVQKADLDRTYVAYAKTLDRFFDSATEETSLLLPLECPELVERARELRKHSPSAFYGDYYFPNLVIKRDMPPMKRHRRGLILSYAENLYAHQRPLEFNAELVVPKDYTYIPDLDFYTTQMMNGPVAMANNNRV
jgi:hypothetical protein